MNQLTDDFTCSVFCSDLAKVARVKANVQQMPGLSKIFRSLADETRVRIAYCLLHEELCCCDLANVLDMTPPAVAHHLRILRDHKLVKTRRDGKVVFYSLDDDHVVRLLEQSILHSKE